MQRSMSSAEIPKVVPAVQRNSDGPRRQIRRLRRLPSAQWWQIAQERKLRSERLQLVLSLVTLIQVALEERQRLGVNVGVEPPAQVVRTVQDQLRRDP